MNDLNKIEIFKYAAYFIAFLLVAIRVGGVHFIFLFFIKMLRVDFNNESLKNKSDVFYDVKLFKFFTGVNARNISDVCFIQGCVNKGLIRPIEFLFSGFFGFAGSKRSNKYDIIAVIFLSIVSVTLAFMCASQAGVYKKGYAIYSFDNQTKYYLNQEHILDSKNGRELDCQRIDFLEGVNKARAGVICPYLKKENVKMSEAVSKGIENNERDRNTFAILELVFMIFFLILSLGFFNFNRSSARLRQLKLDDLRYKRQNRS